MMSESKMHDAFVAQAANRRELTDREVNDIVRKQSSLAREIGRLDGLMDADADLRMQRTWFYYGWQAAMAESKKPEGEG